LPIGIGGTSGVRDVAAGNGFTCIIDASQEVRCWGRNAEGQLGNGTTTATATVPLGEDGAWAPEFARGPMARDVDGDGCEDP
jgi:alpha-tubulin suppressor-like RCC1 family protein